MNWKGGIVSGIAAGTVILLVGMLSGSMLSAEYVKTVQLWKPMTGSWWYFMIVIDIIEGILYAMVFSMVSGGIPGEGWKKGLNYGIILWLVSTVPGMLMTYSTMAVPDVLVASWLFGGLLSLIVSGILIAAIQNKIK
jgi:hypothetical protein